VPTQLPGEAVVQALDEPIQVTDFCFCAPYRRAKVAGGRSMIDKWASLANNIDQRLTRQLQFGTEVGRLLCVGRFVIGNRHVRTVAAPWPRLHLSPE
jgi:hypothetical protein